jgi:hypothetical protein
MESNKVIIAPVKSKASQEAHTSHIYTRNHRSKKRQRDMAKRRTGNDITTYSVRTTVREIGVCADALRQALAGGNLR